MEMPNITSYEMLESITQEFTAIIEDLWKKILKIVNITKWSKV